VEARWLQWLLFAGLGVVLVGALRRRLRPRMAGDPAVDGLVGELAIPQEDLAPGATGRADLRGAPWTAINDGGTMLRGGQRCRVSRAENLTIYIRAE
jgi:membrane protein implicated in regulation of membrane protease activity